MKGNLVKGYVVVEGYVVKLRPAHFAIQTKPLKKLMYFNQILSEK